VIDWWRGRESPLPPSKPPQGFRPIECLGPRVEALSFWGRLSPVGAAPSAIRAHSAALTASPPRVCVDHFADVTRIIVPGTLKSGDLTP
jgi:hypothetical protein